jgi:hypothetical protein
LDALQHVHLPRLAEYDFAKQLGQWSGGRPMAV